MENVAVCHLSFLYRLGICIRYILMLIKRRPATQLKGFVENKYRHEHVMITKLYIVSYIFITTTFMNAFFESFVHA